MTMRMLFFAYMMLVGVGSGAIIATAPQVTEFWLKPYFWVLLAVAAFEGIAFVSGRNTPATMLTMDARVIGFVIGAVLMFAIPSIVGTQARFF